MKLLNIRTDGGVRLGVKTERGVIDIVKSLELVQFDGVLPITVDDVIARGDSALSALDEYVRRVVEVGLAEAEIADGHLADPDHSANSDPAGSNIADSYFADVILNEDDICLAPCVHKPGKIICVGLNYRRHAQESDLAVPDTPLLFSKFSNALAAHGDEIAMPRQSMQIDYEAEFTLVIGKRASNVAVEDALDYVIGYCNGNDLSARDLQFQTSQWLIGKSLDGFCPIGPYLVTADEVGDPQRLRVRCWVNGEERQNGHTSNMIFSCAEIVSYASSLMTLEPGDVILTGTPDGVIFGYAEDKQVWLKEGDVIVVEVEKLGRLVNRLRGVVAGG